MEKSRKALINAIFLVGTLIVNTLGATGVINGLSQKQISDMYITLLTPSPATFSIWSVIYILLIVSVIMMIVKKRDLYYQKVVDQISILFWISCLFNIAWIVTFSFLLIEISVLFILGFVITLSVINQKLLAMHERKRWLLPLSFGLYTGWLFVASVVNIAAALVKMEWDGFGIAPEIWGIIILIVAVFLIILVQLANQNAAFPLPIAWAYFGIYQFLKAPEGFKGEYGLLQTTAIVGMAVLIGAVAIQLYRNHFLLLPVVSSKRQVDAESAI